MQVLKILTGLMVSLFTVGAFALPAEFTLQGEVMFEDHGPAPIQMELSLYKETRRNLKYRGTLFLEYGEFTYEKPVKIKMKKKRSKKWKGGSVLAGNGFESRNLYINGRGIDLASGFGDYVRLKISLRDEVTEIPDIPVWPDYPRALAQPESRNRRGRVWDDGIAELEIVQ